LTSLDAETDSKLFFFLLFPPSILQSWKLSMHSYGMTLYESVLLLMKILQNCIFCFACLIFYAVFWCNSSVFNLRKHSEFSVFLYINFYWYPIRIPIPLSFWCKCVTCYYAWIFTVFFGRFQIFLFVHLYF